MILRNVCLFVCSRITTKSTTFIIKRQYGNHKPYPRVTLIFLSLKSVNSYQKLY